MHATRLSLYKLAVRARLYKLIYMYMYILFCITCKWSILESILNLSKEIDFKIPRTNLSTKPKFKWYIYFLIKLSAWKIHSTFTHHTFQGLFCFLFLCVYMCVCVQCCTPERVRPLLTTTQVPVYLPIKKKKRTKNAKFCWSGRFCLPQQF